MWILTQQVNYCPYILHSSNTGEEMGYNEAVNHLFIGFKKVYDSAKMEVLCNILIEFVFPINLITLIKMFLNETYSRVRVGKICLIRIILRII
jgi:hypothetical protein